MRLEVKRLVCVVFLLLSFTSCASTKKDTGPAVRIDSIRAQKPQNIKTVELKVAKVAYEQSLKGAPAINRVRLVEVYTRAAEGNGKEYRFFDIRKGSVYELLGLQNSDILIAANGYVVPTQAIFWRYVHLLPKQKEAFIEIRRAGLPMLINYTFES